MIPEIGHFSLILALAMALALAVMPLAGSARGVGAWTAVARPAAWGQLLFLALSFAMLAAAFVTNDFSVAYVARNSNSALPLAYRISAVWGAHEGSLLLWALVLGVWTAAVATFSRALSPRFVARVLSVMGLVSVGFLLFLLLTSNPFDRLVPAAVEGTDLNPLLQDPALVMHPPMLYMGYVGLSVPFAFAIAALLEGRLDAAWARWSRPWTAVAWLFLTLGITLGSWWAYYELGWGGWWFWDPVENASFMPWLVATALIHSLAVAEKRGMFMAWTVLLAIFAFSLSLLGTFLVRSGVLTSVHAFATDPARGVFILLFLGAVVGGSLLLYALRAPRLRAESSAGLLSLETLLLINNVLLTVAAASVLLGTLYPLVLEAVGAGKISVGPPYFQSVFVPLTVPLVVLLAVGPLVRWKRDSAGRIARLLGLPLAAAVTAGMLAVALLGTGARLQAALGIMLGAWVLGGSLVLLAGRLARRDGMPRLRGQPRGFWGMWLAHLGVGVFVVGATMTTLYGIERDVRLAPGESVEISGYRFRFDGADLVSGPNYEANRGTVSVLRGDDPVTTLHPEKRFYRTQPTNPMTEAGIDAGATRDFYSALGDRLDGGAWTLRLYVKPYVRWIWGGALLMVLGGILAATDRRYRATLSARDEAGAADAAAGPAGAPAASR